MTAHGRSVTVGPVRTATEPGAPAGPEVADYPGQHWLGQDPETAGPRPPAEVLGGLTMPALVVAGEQDMPCFLEMTGTLARGIPGAEHTLIAGAGHMVNLERPAEVNALLADFLTKAANGAG